jgi:gliding motility-associated-like protein
MKPAKCFNRFSVSFTLVQKVLNTPILFALIILLASVNSSKALTKYKNPILPPVAVCKNISVSLGTGGSVIITGTDVNGGSYDPDGTIVNMSVTPDTFTCSQIGTNTVNLTVTDNEGKSSTCNATVTVEDKTPPVMICRNYTVYLDALGKGTLKAADVNNGSSDNCTAGLLMYISKTDFSCSDIGSPVMVNLIGTDASGNSSSCSSQVTVLDTISPVINSKPFDLILGPSGTGTLLPSDIDNGTFDNCGGVTLSVSPNTFSCIDLGQKQVTLTAVDSHGNSSSRQVIINISSSLNINSMFLSTCDLSPTLALFESDPEGGDGNYSYFWRGLNPATKPFMVIIALPPSLQFYNTTILESPFFNNAMANGYYSIRLVVTDGKGCADSSEITIDKTGAIFNNQTFRHSDACEGEIKTYSVNFKSDATYDWSVTNGTILNSNTDTSKIDIRWNLGVVQGRVVTTLHEPNVLFGGGQCESTITDTVTIIPIPTPVFNNPVISVCSNSIITYTLTSAYPVQDWVVTGGVITAGGKVSDNYVTVLWGKGPAGNISVSAGNNSLCTGSAGLNISISNLTGKILSQSDITCNGGTDGSVTVAADNGTGIPPYSYSIDGSTFQAEGTFTGLSLGNHIATIRDALLCTFDLPFVIDQPAPVSGIVSARSNVSCFGGTNGSATITASGGSSPYQYRLNGGTLQSSNIFNGLSAGSYIVTVQDIHGCTGNVLFSISQPVTPLNGISDVTEISCFGESTGRIDLTVTGGTAPYTFQWSNGATLEDLVNVAAGNYSVIITDASGCTATIPETVGQPALALSGTTSVTNVLCFGGSTGAVNLTVNGGTPPYSFVWTNGALTEDLLNVPAGSYTVTITDSKGCTKTVAATVTGPSAAVGGSIVAQTNVSCYGGNNGTVTVSGTGGVSPYSYQLGSGAFQSSGTFGSLSAGSYNITIRDANMCVFIMNLNISQPAAALSGSIVQQTDILCYGDATGSVIVNGTGGTSPYDFNADGGAFQISGTLGGLTAGAHTVMVRDKNLCTVSLPVIILQPASPLNGTIVSQTNVKCNGETTGTAAVTGSGGTSPFTYSIDGGTYQSSGLFENLGAGAHSIVVRDFNLCIKTLALNITQPASPLAVTTSHSDVLCMGGTNGTATAIPSGGTAPYTYSWNTIPVQTSGVATGLPAGNYTVTVNDINGCISSAIVDISQPSSALTAAIITSDVSCNGGNNGSVNLTVTNGTAPLSFLWSNGAITEDLNSVNAGTYSVSVTDANGCIATASAVINQPAALTGNISAVNVACYGESTGSCHLTVSGGTLPYTFLWNNGAVTEDINNLAAGSYSITVTDSHNCTVIINASVSQPSSALTSSIASKTNVTVYGGNDGSATVSGSGGTPPYQYCLNSGAFQPTGNFSSLSAGTYTLTVRDAGMCTSDVSVTITQPWIPLTANIVSQTNVTCQGGGNGSVTVAGWGGTLPYVYSIDGGLFQPSGTFDSLSAGNYIIAVRDVALDLFVVPVTISETEAISIAVSGEDIHCYGGNTGSVTAVVTGGTSPYSYSWNTIPVQDTPTATGLPAGTYTVTVTDANGCTASNEVIISQPAVDMAISITQENVICAGGATGAATAVVTGGLEPFTYSWDTPSEQTKETATDLSAGTYSITVTDSYGCIKTGSVTITETLPLSIESTATDASCPDSQDGSITLIITGGTGPYSTLWSDGIATQNRAGVGPGQYNVIVTDHNNCTKPTVIDVGYTWSFNCVVIPQVITPNNDGFNDEWRIKNIDLYPNAEVRVFNRWGKLVFSTRNLSDNPWDGRLNGKLVPTDSYHYILYLNDGSEPRSGVISVIR